MKKMITTGLMVCMLGVGVGSGANSTSYNNVPTNTIEFADWEYYGSKYFNDSDTKENNKCSSFLKISALIVGSVAAVYGMDYALTWATKIGLPGSIKSYKFGTLCNKTKEVIQKAIANSPKLLEYIKRLPGKIKSVPQLIKEIPNFVKNVIFKITKNSKKLHNYLIKIIIDGLKDIVIIKNIVMQHMKNAGEKIIAIPGQLKALPALIISFPRSTYKTYNIGKEAQNSICWNFCSFLPTLKWFNKK
ncbi:hypothetical protein KAT08_03005 [Candidatus Babeliales bacterium]|nr:hypothetical protein [Candidatus Babeliales bacterium]